jgi:hypothetical protein
MKFSGTLTELDIVFDEADYDVSEAVVAKNRIAIDWEEAGEPFHVVLTSSDGVYFEGHYGSPLPNPNWKMQGTKYTAADKGVLLIVNWFQTDNGNEGACLFELEPVDN